MEYPLIIGDGVIADTNIHTIDIDSNDNLAFGGYGYADSSNKDKPILGFY